jgi:hypothetical protein
MVLHFQQLRSNYKSKPILLKKSSINGSKLETVPTLPGLGHPRNLRNAISHIFGVIFNMIAIDQRPQPLGEIILNLNLPVSEKTLERAIVNDLGMGHRIEGKTPWLSKKQKQARLAFAKTFISWTLEDWRRVIWTDEMGMQTGANGKRVYVWRYPEEELKKTVVARR